ncbi:MAG: hypothetical protein HYY23_21240, partial [Verrucomicrobia bacterium]|nr:hypothetical protein [Verrucomicrobiota bacterium]
MTDLLQTMLEIQELQLIRNKKPERNPTLAALRQKVPAQILAHLDRLLDRGKKGVAVAHNGVCMECHMRIPIGDVATLMHGNDIQLCANCGRYLYLPESELPSHQPPPPPP